MTPSGPSAPPNSRWPLLLVAVVAGGAALWLLARRDAPAGELPGGLSVAPLRPAEGGERPRFRRLDPATSGIAFTNLLKKQNTYTYLTNGAGLAVGDYDGDGLDDVYLISQDGPNQLFRQKAPLVFENVTERAGVVDGGQAWGTGASFADVDGDGDLDLYVCNMEAKNLLYVNQGDGTFREDAQAFGLDVVAASTMAAFADYDRDGRLDVYLLTNRALHAGWAETPQVLKGIEPPADTVRPAAGMVPTQAQWRQIVQLQQRGALTDDETIPAELREHYLTFRGQAFMSGQPDRLLRNVGGRFVDVSGSAGITGYGMGLSAVWWDYDDDGWPDLYVGNDLESPDVLYHNQRDGTFRVVTGDVLPHTAYYGMGSDAGDVDGDGRLDYLIADMSMTTHKKAKVLMGDMNRQRDMLIHCRPPQYMRNALLVNTGLGRFQEAGILAGVASTDWTWSALFGDLDNDARLDLFVTNGIARFEMDPDFQMQVAELWQQQREQAAIDLIQNVRKVPEKNLALRNAGDLEFQKTGADWGLDLEAVSQGAALVDLDGDGDLDVVINNWNEPAAVYENRTADGNALAVALRGQRSNPFGIGARVTARLPDGTLLVRELWLSRGYFSGQSPVLHFGLGRAQQVAELTVRWPSGHLQTFADVAAGQRCTITEPPGAAPPPPPAAAPPPALFAPGNPPPFQHRENEFDEYVDQPLLPAGVSRLGPGLALGDADGDGDDDLFVGGARGQAGALFLATDKGWQPAPGPWQQDAAGEDLAALWLDHDGDGDLDLFVTSGGAEMKQGDPTLRDRLYRNDGGGRFVRDEQALPDVRESSGHAAAADFDRDGDLDLFVAGRLVPGLYPDAPASRLYRNDGGRFTDATAELAPALPQAGMVTSALFTDVDGDGWPDLLVAAHWQPIRLLRNEAGRFADATVAAGLAAHSGWWNSLCAWDCDADGDLDYVAGNQGLNTKYKARPDHPVRLYFADFDDNGTRDLVEARYEGDNLLPVRGRSCSSQAMPFLATKFPTYEQFASSLLKDIYPQQKLDTCGKLEVTTLASCLLRNDGKGRFTVEPLPRRAQIAPIFGMVALGDLLVCAQNSYAPEPETGRNDGGTGLVLRAGDGGLAVVPPHEHGICWFGDRKALVLRADRGGRTELLFANNDDALRAETLRGAGRAPLVLAGAKGNPLGVGTFVVFESAGGRRRASEVQAGSGYLSHSPRLFVPADAVRATLRAPDGTVTVQDLPR
ncbi:MAG: RNA-binding protein [Planctomycetes bacterium]|nr:RNA-binding protein [Planctomycetota bacterium]